MSAFHLVTYVKVKPIGRVKVSTAQMPGGIHGNGYETCLFWRGDSCVKAIHYNESEATRSHAYWSRPEVVASVIGAAMREREDDDEAEVSADLE